MIVKRSSVLAWAVCRLPAWVPVVCEPYGLSHRRIVFDRVRGHRGL